MAYGDKYTSYFYNFFKKIIRVKIKKRDYSGAIDTTMRITDLQIETNYQDETTPVIGTGAKVTFLADADNFSTYEDLLTSKEKEFYCEIYYNVPGDQGIPVDAPSNVTFTNDVNGTNPAYFIVVEVSNTERSPFTARILHYYHNDTTTITINCDALTFGNKFIVFTKFNSKDPWIIYSEIPSTPMDVIATMVDSTTKYNEIVAMPVHAVGTTGETELLVFSGFSICDLNERQLLPFAHITMQFTDYIKRMEDKMDLPCLSSLSANIRLFDVVRDIIKTIDGPQMLYVNSTLLEEDMIDDSDNTDTLVEQLFVESNIFYSDATTHDNAYDALNKILLPLGSHIYSFGGIWVIERIEDITRAGVWSRFTAIYYDDAVAAATPSLKQEINKQAEDFKYIEESQVLEYASGLQKLIINLKETQLDTTTFNDYDPLTIHTTTSEWPTAQTLIPREWYIHNTAINIFKGFSYRTMSSYLQWGYPYSSNQHANENAGLYYAFTTQFNESPDNPTSLNISYKMSSDDSVLNNLAMGVSLRCHIIVDGGPKSGYFLAPISANESGNEIPTLTTSNAYYWERITSITSPEIRKEKVWTFDISINLTDTYVLNSIGSLISESVWSQLGKPIKQQFIICFWPPKIYLPEVDQGIFFNNLTPYMIPRTVYIGDISTAVTQRDIPNKFTYYINEEFLNTEEIDFELMDLKNANFANGFLVKDAVETALHPSWTAYQKTELWTSENSPELSPLVDIFAKMRFRNYYKTMHNIKAKILYDGHLKPFTILTDDTIIIDSAADIKFIINQYSWDLVNGTYDIQGQEYTDEDIVIDGVADSSAYPGDSSGEIPPAAFLPPVWYSVLEDLTSFFVTVMWNGVFSATGYRLRRYPYWQIDKSGTGGVWIQDFKEIYAGPSWSFVDHIESEGVPIEGMTVIYIVCAYNDNQSTAYSSQYSIGYTLTEGGLPM